MPRAFVVVNPRSGGSHVESIERALVQYLRPPWVYAVQVLAPGQDAGPLLRRQVATGVDTVIAAGGDGTVRVAADALVGTRVELAILPEGTANVIAHDAGIPLRVDEALQLVTGPHEIMELDAIRVGEACYFLNLSIGLSAGIIRDTDTGDKRRFGIMAYVWSGAKNLLAVGVKDVLLWVDGREHHLRATEVLVANCPSMGLAELRASADIDPSDGRLQVIAFRARHLGDYFYIGRELLVHRPHARRHVQVFDVEREVRISCPEPLDVQADGDLIGCTPIEATVLPGAVRLVVPPGRGSGWRRTVV
jgi:diacylglycerol kinase (ATP)